MAMTAAHWISMCRLGVPRESVISPTTSRVTPTVAEIPAALINCALRRSVAEAAAAGRRRVVSTAVHMTITTATSTRIGVHLIESRLRAAHEIPDGQAFGAHRAEF